MFCELGSFKVYAPLERLFSLLLDEMAPLRSEATPKSGRGEGSTGPVRTI